MNIVVAPDSFKGSLTAKQVTNIIAKSILNYNSNYTVSKKPMADGGEGTIESLLSATDGEKIAIGCTGPLGNEIATHYAIIDGHTAVIECAKVAGLTQVPESSRNPDHTTSYGMGEVIVDALDKGCTSMIIGLGGSATNDAGLGMLLALGLKAYDQHGKEVGIYGKDVDRVAKVDFTNIDPRISDIQIKVASDVNNPLYGDNGASAVYGPQKGATVEQVIRYDQALKTFSQAVDVDLNKTLHNIPGSGAAGGLGYGLLTLEAELVSGATLLAQAMHVEDVIKQADLVITGEGQSDEQTLYGKAPGYIASLAQKYKIPIILLSGSLQDLEQLSTTFSGYFSIINRPLTLAECMDQANILLYEQTKQIIQMVDTVRVK